MWSRRNWVGGVLLLGLAAAWPASAQDYPPNIPDAVVRTYKTIDGIDLRAWILLPPEHRSTDSRPAMVFFFGGGWAVGTPAHFERQARELSARGMVAVLADYRVGSRHGTTPADAVEDAKSAVRWIRRNAKELGIDPNRIGAAGGSAGGHLAVATATVPGMESPGEDLSVSSVPDALALFNPVVVLAPEPGVFDLPERLLEVIGDDPLSVSPYHHLAPGTPPTLIQHGRADELVPFATAVAYCDRAREQGDRCEVAGYDDAPHGFFNNAPFYEATLQRMLQFLEALDWIATR